MILDRLIAAEQEALRAQEVDQTTTVIHKIAIQKGTITYLAKGGAGDSSVSRQRVWYGACVFSVTPEIGFQMKGTVQHDLLPEDQRPIRF